MNDNDQIDVLNNNDCLDQTIDELEILKTKFNKLSEEKNNMETDFGFKRARFKEIMLKKEENMRNQNEENQQKIEELQIQLQILKNELDNNRSLLTVFQHEQENKKEIAQQKHEEEVFTIRQFADDNIKKIKANHEYDLEQYKKLDNEFNNIKSQLKNESMLSVVTKSLKQKVGSLNATNLLLSPFDVLKFKENEDFNFILPLEEENKLLKDKLRNTDKILRVYEQIIKIVVNEIGSDKFKKLIDKIPNKDILIDFEEIYQDNKLSSELNFQINNENIINMTLIDEKKDLQSEMNKSNEKQELTKNNFKNDLKEIEKKPKLFDDFYTSNKLKRSQSLILLSSNKQINKYDEKSKLIRVLEHENQSLKIRLNKPCEMCLNYELQLQTVQLSESETVKKLENCQKKFEHHRQETIREQEYRNQLEDSFNKETSKVKTTLNELEIKLETFNYKLEELKLFVKNKFILISDKIKKVIILNENLKKQLKNMFYENSILLGKYVTKSQKLQAEIIDLPQDLNEMQFYCLKIREDLIAVSLAKERLEENFHKELCYLKDKQESDYCNEKLLGKSLTTDNEKLKNDLENSKNELDILKLKYQDLENLYEKCQFNLNNTQTEFYILQSDLQKKLFLLDETKVQLENENINLKFKLQNLQSELDNSETVQRDFVKLSQSLQIQLEKIRQAGFEVRWQHEDDVCECNNCKKVFHSKKEKNHCSHCGKVFCSECNNKTVLGGPNRRKFKVCHVCHTLLNRETAPYFSNEVIRNFTSF